MNVTGNLAYKTIPTNKGNNLIMLKNYTFSKHTKSRNYYCSSKLKGCRARFKMDEKGDIIHGDFTHTHDPPKYAISSSGHNIKLQSLDNAEQLHIFKSRYKPQLLLFEEVKEMSCSI
ncbi:hypothetical protein ABMA28_001394 [Loxostege sticticalis]|uniref:FLYWCH-type domain-containing protein n=1 Tax=Loxostege sticticalis TaxID=481309 RepID=A0ABD0T1H3_LOXSC